MENRCVSCGIMIPEGRMVCPNCEAGHDKPDAILKDGTRLYLKTSAAQKDCGIQSLLYNLLMRGQNEN